MATIFHGQDMEFNELPSPIKSYGIHTTPGIWNAATAKQLSFDIRRLDAGKYSFPYHYHHAAEELFYIISGKGKLRHPDGQTIIQAGDLIHFPMGMKGAHQVFNDGEETLEYLDIRTIHSLDAISYPDTGKTGIIPALKMFIGQGDVDYWEGEEMPEQFWKGLPCSE